MSEQPPRRPRVQPILPPAPRPLRRRRFRLTQVVRLLVMLAGSAVVVLLAVTIWALVTDYLRPEGELSQEEYNRSRWTPGADR